MVQWLLEYGGAQITDTDNEGGSVWTDNLQGAYCLPAKLMGAYVEYDDGEDTLINGDFLALTAMLCVLVLHGGPPESLAQDQQIVKDGARLRARLPAYLAQRRVLLDAHCPLLPPLLNLVHGYEEPTTTDELWATGLGIPLERAKRSRPERDESP
jgi:hypothetical protein